MIESQRQMPSTPPEQTAPPAVGNASSVVETEAVDPMASFLAPDSSSRDGGAGTDMRAVNAETTTQVPDVQNKGPLYSLGTTPIKLQKLCNHPRGYKDNYF